MKKFSKLITFALALTLVLALASTALAATWSIPDHGTLTGTSAVNYWYVEVNTSISKPNGVMLQNGIQIYYGNYADPIQYEFGTLGVTPLYSKYALYRSADTQPTRATCYHYALVSQENGSYIQYGGTTSVTITN